MFEHYYAVIMAGGEGSRLWPLSRQSRPKQMVKLGSDRSLFQIAVDRLQGVFPADRIYVVTVADQAAGLQEQYPDIPQENYLLEPMQRGTASVAGLAALALRARDPQATMAILTADHIIQHEEYFRDLLRQAYTLAQDDYLVTLGIHPTSPSTGYGYIQRGEPLEQHDFIAYQVKHFKEKPDLETARTFLARGDHDWNSGMFVWRVDRIWEEIQRWMPNLLVKLDEIARDWTGEKRDETLHAVWPTIKPQTIDYGIMENADRAAVIPAVDLGWNDVGSWDSIFEVFPAGENDNVILDADHLGIDTTNSLVVSDRTGRLVVTLDVHDLVVVDTKDAVLVCARKSVQRVKEIVNAIKQQDETKRFL